MIASPNELNYFLEVAHTGNISRAAERLGISQPTLSVAIQKLERSVGVPLLVRNKTGVHLTRSGTRLAAQARDLIQNWENIRKETLADEERIGGRYVIGCHPSVALYCLRYFLPSLLKEHPRLEVKLVHDLSRKVTEEIISFRVDFGLVVNPVAHPELVIRELFQDEVAFWIATAKPTASDPSVAASTLICDPELHQTQQLIAQARKKGWNFDRILTTSSLEVATELVRSGIGAGILPTRVAQRSGETPALRLLAPTLPKWADRICLVYRADAQKSKTSRLLAQRIESALKAET